MPNPGSGTDPTSEDDPNISLPGWIDNPERKIRNVVFGALLSGFGSILNEIFGAGELLVLGSNAGVFGARGEIWGIADLPAVLFRLGGDVVAFLIGSAFDILTSLISGTVPQTPGPISGLIATLVVVVLLVAVVRIGGPLLLAGLEAIPVVGGPISTILGRFL
ncbi:hypothetical protein [Halobellus ordinarius]|uniref:hypothetical protein n=1 Tax=Halobellus ordinarius TaxID=3075120 RepID=UPI002880936D|nr:hypothetical protein [Halobellus sp. ZY16]